MRRTLLVSILAVVGACGDDGGSSGQVDASTDGSTVDSSTVDAAIDAPAGVFTLMSLTLTGGAVIPVVHTCDGANTSPALSWENPPPGTMSYAIVFTDKTNGLIHAVIYDIPMARTDLPADVDKVYAPPDVPGAHQTTAYPVNNPPRGYLGPCPPPADPAHSYEFMLYALNVPTLPTATMATSRMDARTLIQANDIAMVALTGTVDRN